MGNSQIGVSVQEVYLGDFQVLFDGVTVWVNSSGGVCVARFGRAGIDIHRDIEDQLAGSPQCLRCTHSRPMVEDWRLFVEDVERLYNVRVPEESCPAWIA